MNALKKAMKADNSDIKDGMELRSACISEISVDTVKSTIKNLSASSITEKGVTQVRNFNPYREVPGTTMAWELNVTTRYAGSGANLSCMADFNAGSWLGLSKVDFQDGATGFTAQVKGKGLLAITTGNPGKWGTYIVIAEVDSENAYTDITVPLFIKAEGVQDKLFFMADGKIRLKSWSFIK